MKTTLVSFAVALLTSILPAAGQAPPDFSALCKEEMKKLAYLAGQWEGDATITGPGPARTLKQHEEAQFRLDSTVLVIEGMGTDDAGDEVLYNAMAVINFNASTREYGFRSFLKDGRSTDAYFKVISDNKFEWGFAAPGNTGKVRYTILLDPADQSWHEIGEFTADGATWMKFMEMRLHKKG